MDLGFDIVDLPSCSPPDVGESAPSFEAPLVDSRAWRDRHLTDLLEEGPVLLLFHPMIGSFPATYIWDTITERSWVNRFDVTPVGVVISTPYDISRFIHERDIDGELFSDPSNDIARRYDVVHDLDGMAGISEPRPAVFLIDEDQSIRYRWYATEWPSFPDYDEVEAALESL